MIARDCPDDLLVAARRGALSDLERQALSAHLGRCELCRAGELAAGLLRHPLRAGEGEPSVADRALLERVAERASAQVANGNRHAGVGWRRAALGVAVFLGLGGAASAWIGQSWLAPRAAAPARTAIDTLPSVRHHPHRGESLAAATPEPAAPLTLPVSPGTAPRKRVVGRVERIAAPVVSAPPETAASLFAEANAARRDGDLRRAVTLYESLRVHFADSDQARLSSISLGDLLVRLDEPARALRAFDAYLAEVRTGALREEALYARARCLRKLGEPRAQEETETWVRLLHDFPGSAYAPTARQRLDELRQPR